MPILRHCIEQSIRETQADLLSRLESFIFIVRENFCFVYLGVVSHIPKFGDASKSPAGDTTSLAGDAASPSGDAVVSHWRFIISFRDAHPPHSHPHLPREMWSHIYL
jgi:hypothetical protein